ncbi:MAG: LuxR C-terminal-related transcriptional regulator [Actinomycetota bacterium]
MWMDAFNALVLADEAAPLGAEDLWLLAMSAYLIGRDDDNLRAIDRAYRAHLETGEVLRAARAAFWLGFRLLDRGEMGKATGWLGRSGRLVEREGHDCVERGYLLLPVVLQKLFAGEYEASSASAADATEIGERFGDADLTALALHLQGCARIKQGQVDDGLALLDEAMVAVTTDELSPVVTGLIYCSVIEACREVYAVRRSQEWTVALTQWCEGQPDLVPYAGQCLVHRAEIMQLHGAWRDALEEARRATERLARGVDQPASAAALYQQGEIHRLLGEFAAAEEAFLDASRRGLEPQPGLALLRLAQGNNDAAAAAIRRVVGETTDSLERARLLPAYIEIMLATGDPDGARSACLELGEIAEGYASGVLGAMASGATGAIELAEGNARSALVSLRHAEQVWKEFGAPYEVARVRELIGLACDTLGDHDTAALELDAARGAFEHLGAAPDFARVDSLTRHAPSGDNQGLAPRELQVLRLVAAGKTNKAIAAELVVSERTVDRHVSNVFAKLGVSSRAAATAFAYEHRLV